MLLLGTNTMSFGYFCDICNNHSKTVFSIFLTCEQFSKFGIHIGSCHWRNSGTYSSTTTNAHCHLSLFVESYQVPFFCSSGLFSHSLSLSLIFIILCCSVYFFLPESLPPEKRLKSSQSDFIPNLSSLYRCIKQNRLRMFFSHKQYSLDASKINDFLSLSLC
jgi:hypothetical protein